MKFCEIIEKVICRGDFVSNKMIYENHGEFPVYSATTTGPVGFYKNYNYITKSNSFIISLNGNAGFVSLVKEASKVFIGSDCGVIEIKQNFLKKYNKEIIAIWLQDFCIKNRHVNGTQPKFAIDRNYNKQINENILNIINNIDLSAENIDDQIYKRIGNLNLARDFTSKKILLKDMIDKYKERGKRLVKGRELYYERGNVKAISSTTTGPMGYYNTSNYNLEENDFVYSIDGANAGYISLYLPQPVFITDHAGVITIKKEYVQKYGKLVISLFLQDYFVKQASKGTQPTFLLKNNLNLELNLGKLEVLSQYINDSFLSIK